MSASNSTLSASGGVCTNLLSSTLREVLHFSRGVCISLSCPAASGLTSLEGGSLSTSPFVCRLRLLTTASSPRLDSSPQNSAHSTKRVVHNFSQLRSVDRQDGARRGLAAEFGRLYATPRDLLEDRPSFLNPFRGCTCCDTRSPHLPCC